MTSAATSEPHRGAEPAGDQADKARADAALFAEVRPAVADVLRRRFGRGADVAGHEFVHHDGHPVLAVVQVTGAPVGSVVAKVAARDPGAPFSRDEAGPWSPYSQLANEWCVLDFFTRRGQGRLPVPEFYGGDLDAGVVVMADLGAGDSLAEVLLRVGGAADAQAALAGYVDSFVALHAASFGQTETFRQARACFGVAGDVFAGPTQNWPQVQAAAESLRAAPPAAVVGQVERLAAHAAGAGRWQVVSLRDVCPDNNRVLADGRVVLFDGQFAGVQHALVDVAYLHSTMPTCWCVRRLPDGLADRLVGRYLAGLRATGFDVGDAEFDRELRMCRAFMALWRMLGALTRVGPDDGEREPSHWDHYDFDMPTMRQEVLLRTGQVVDALRPLAGFDELRAWVSALGAAGRAAWPSTRPLPLYPAWTRRE